MKLLFTGASGFLGINVYPKLSLKYTEKTLGLTRNDYYKVNLANEVPLLDTKFNIVLHAAGKAHSVPRTKTEENDFFRLICKEQKIYVRLWKKSGFRNHLFLLVPLQSMV